MLSVGKMADDFKIHGFDMRRLRKFVIFTRILSIQLKNIIISTPSHLNATYEIIFIKTYGIFIKK